MNPVSIDLRPNVDQVFDQGTIGSCTANAGIEADDVMRERASVGVVLSRLFLYYNERVDQGHLGDTGAMPSEITKQLIDKGSCLESTWPYDIANMDVQPPPTAYAEALNYRMKSAEILNLGAASSTLDYIIDRIETSIARGFPVLQTSNVPQSFMHLTGPWRTQHFDMATSPSNPLVGSHETLIIGYDHAAQMFLCQNSWGPTWGDGGFFGVPYSYMANAWISQLWFIDDCGVKPINAGWRPDVTDQQDVIQQCYIAYFGRPADLGGLNYWAGLISQIGLPAILDDFHASAESQALYGTGDIIPKVYLNLFNRAPDPGGLAYWEGQLSSGALTLGNIVFAILNGAQGSDAACVAAKTEAANVLTFDTSGYYGTSVPAARAWLAQITSPSQVQPEVQSLPL